MQHLPVYARALDAECDSQVDAGPAWLRLPAVSTDVIPWDGQHPLEGTLTLHGPGVAPGIQTAQGCRGLAIQFCLTKEIRF